MGNLATILSEVSTLTTISQLDAVYNAFKTRSTQLNRHYAGEFKLGQHVRFRVDGMLYEGNVDNIARTGKIKVKLINSSYTAYNLGAGILYEAILKA